MSAETTLPERGTYRYILRKYAAHDPSIPETVSCYTESLISRDITHPDGLRRRTIFPLDPNSRERLVKLGWEDVTEHSIALQLASPPATQASKRPGPSKTLRVEG